MAIGTLMIIFNYCEKEDELECGIGLDYITILGSILTIITFATLFVKDNNKYFKKFRKTYRKLMKY